MARAICSRYRDVGRTSRQAWAWWRPVLSGKPETDKQRQLEYRFFKRDVLKELSEMGRMLAETEKLKEMLLAEVAAAKTLTEMRSVSARIGGL